MSAHSFLDQYLEPVTEVLTPSVAKAIVDLRPADDVVARVAELGRKSDDGTLTSEEREEYKSLADAGTMISLLKAKARRFLSR